MRRREIDQRFESLKELLDERAEADRRAVDAALRAAKEATDAALTSAKDAVNKAEAGQLRVNATQNEFRGALKDQAATLITRAEHSTAIGHLQSQIDDLKSKDSARAGGEHGRGLQTGTLLAVAGLTIAAISVASLLLR